MGNNFLHWKTASIKVTCVCHVLSHVRLFVTPGTAARQAPLSMGFSKQEHWSGLPCPPAGSVPNWGSNPCLLHWQADSLPDEPSGKPLSINVSYLLKFESVKSLSCSLTVRGWLRQLGKWAEVISFIYTFHLSLYSVFCMMLVCGHHI